MLGIRALQSGVCREQTGCCSVFRAKSGRGSRKSQMRRGGKSVRKRGEKEQAAEGRDGVECLEGSLPLQVAIACVILDMSASFARHCEGDEC